MGGGGRISVTISVATFGGSFRAMGYAGQVVFISGLEAEAYQLWECQPYQSVTLTLYTI